VIEHRADLFRGGFEKVFEEPAFLGGFRVKRKSPPADNDIELALQFFNTPGNEIAPGSDIIGKYFEFHVCRHPFLPSNRESGSCRVEGTYCQPSSS
jgi:hypothetical protein